MDSVAGLTTTVYDLIHYEGGTIANYLEFGGPNYKKALKYEKECFANPTLPANNKPVLEGYIKKLEEGTDIN